jgi:hypothetical protein
LRWRARGITLFCLRLDVNVMSRRHAARLLRVSGVRTRDWIKQAVRARQDVAQRYADVLPHKNNAVVEVKHVAVFVSRVARCACNAAALVAGVLFS